MGKAGKVIERGRIIAAPENHLTAETLRAAQRSRRGFLGGSAAIAGALAAASGRALAQAAYEPPNVPPWTRTLGAPVTLRPYGTPSEFEANVVRRQSPGPLSSWSQRLSSRNWPGM